MSDTIPDAFADRPIRPPFDAELEPVLAAVRAGALPPTMENLPAIRQTVLDGPPGAEAIDLSAGGAVVVDDRDVPGPSGAPGITLLILRPARATGRLPAIYHIHGGGMIMGDRRLGVEVFLPYVVEGTAVVVSVEYRLAPEHPDPAPVEDCYAGLVWTAKNAAEIGVDPQRLMVAGGSAGGGLAAGTALLARDREFPALSHQVLLCPMLDDRLDTPSSRMLDGEGVWDRAENVFGWTALLGERRGGPDVSPYAAAARATDLTRLPRTYLDCGSTDTFRDAVLRHAERLSQAGVAVDLHLWGGGFHGFEIMAPAAAISRAANATRDEFMRRALGA